MNTNINVKNSKIGGETKELIGKNALTQNL